MNEGARNIGLPIIVYSAQMTGRIFASRDYTRVSIGSIEVNKAITKDDVTRQAVVAVWDHLRGCRGCEDCQDYRIAIIKAIAGEITLETTSEELAIALQGGNASQSDHGGEVGSLLGSPANAQPGTTTEAQQ